MQCVTTPVIYRMQPAAHAVQVILQRHRRTAASGKAAIAPSTHLLPCRMRVPQADEKLSLAMRTTKVLAIFAPQQWLSH